MTSPGDASTDFGSNASEAPGPTSTSCITAPASEKIQENMNMKGRVDKKKGFNVRAIVMVDKPEVG